MIGKQKSKENPPRPSPLRSSPSPLRPCPIPRRCNPFPAGGASGTPLSPGLQGHSRPSRRRRSRGSGCDGDAPADALWPCRLVHGLFSSGTGRVTGGHYPSPTPRRSTLHAKLVGAGHCGRPVAVSALSRPCQQRHRARRGRISSQSAAATVNAPCQAPSAPAVLRRCLRLRHPFGDHMAVLARSRPRP